MSDNVTLPGVGTITESKDIGGGIQRQSVMLGDREGSTDDVIGPIDEQAPASDTAPAGLNGRLQRIAQNQTTQRSTAQPISVGDGQNVTFGARTDARSAATDGSSASGMSVLKEISYASQASADINSMLINGVVASPARAPIVASASGATTIIPATSGKAVRVLAMKLTANGAVNVKWQSHVTPTDLTGLSYYAAAGAGEVLPYNPAGWFQTTTGEALDINLSGAVAVGGHITYVLV